MGIKNYSSTHGNAGDAEIEVGRLLGHKSPKIIDVDEVKAS
jgi:hypothetical protein